MESKELAKKLKSLCQLDIDAIHAYMEANKHIEHAEIKETISQFQADHERHVEDFSDVIRTLGDEPPEFSKDFKGFMLEAFAKIRGVTRDEGALKALKGGERMTSREYGEAVQWDISTEIRNLLERNYSEEKGHLAYIERAINEKLWEKAGVR